MIRRYCIGLVFVFMVTGLHSQNAVREDILLNAHWRTVADDKNPDAFRGFENISYNDKGWTSVDVPHNWDDYGGYRVMKHGNRHGYAWYRRSFKVSSGDKGKRIFLWFEGVGSYATVWVNGHEAGKHAGGRTSFTLDITSLVKYNEDNLLAIRADHPAGIQDLPWVCGGCSPEYGFSEGSQPMGIFRPVHLIVTSSIRIEPFGVHIWNNNDISEKSAVLHLETEIKNYGTKSSKTTVINSLYNSDGKKVSEFNGQNTIEPGKTMLQDGTMEIQNPHLWSLEDPYLYTLVTEIRIGKKVIDRIATLYGIRWISWPVGKDVNDHQFLLNGKPVFINGIAEYEHLLGQSHAFSDEQIRARTMEVRAAGFNAFRDAHQPHNLRYQEYWEKSGILWWPQFAAHIWFDSPAFRENFKSLLKDWIKERRNNPSVILWGLENESTLPQSFAEECCAIIRQMDPTASSQRKITTCNGGKGTDWDVPQNWTGTYGGDPAKYAADLKKQQLVGEYGAWRSIDLHTEGLFNQKGPLSEDRMAQLLEMKVRLADSVKNEACGQFLWLLSSHENPGRFQDGEGFRNVDRVGPVNYKGLFTLWDEPLDAFYMYRSNFVSGDKEPMVYIVSHTWPDRWLTPGIKGRITVYSNCDEVELFNDVRSGSLGKRKRGGVGTHFQWDSVDIRYNVLYAEGIINGKVVATDCIVLNHLPKAPHYNDLLPKADTLTDPAPGYHYIYRINCGGPEYKDSHGQTWTADAYGRDTNTWSSHSWADNDKELPDYFASQRRTFDPIKGTVDWPLFQTFRFGRHKLNYEFPLPDGEYRIELYFTEPWYGVGGGLDCTGWRLFDVAFNDSTVIHNLDIWKLAGHDAALKKTITANVKGGRLIISFPHVASGQAVISAIAIASMKSGIVPAPAPQGLIEDLEVVNPAGKWSVQSWMDTGIKQYSDDQCTFSALPHELYGSEWIRTSNNSLLLTDTLPIANFRLTADAEVYLALDTTEKIPVWLNNWIPTKLMLESDYKGGTAFQLLKKHYLKDQKITVFGNGIYGGNKPMYTLIAH
ncbi:MAG TPA: malectin domain-containing carbohydrate-binding protein, partial [Bacteroidales bacterium]